MIYFCHSRANGNPDEMDSCLRRNDKVVSQERQNYFAGVTKLFCRSYKVISQELQNYFAGITNNFNIVTYYRER